jgi:peptide subunit release factor 1 (eRF1)
VGGWSQQRYERRRDKELLHYAREIIDALGELDKRREFDRIILAGSEETINEIRRNLPEPLEKQVIGEKSLDLDEDKEYIDQEIFELFVKEEREAERDLWNEIKNRYLAGGLAQVGVEDVLAALKVGRVREVIVNRNAEIDGTRCRDCKNVFNGDLETCAICGSESVFAVDLINEIVELVKLTSAKIEFADEIQGLKEVGDVAALLRY